MKRISAIFMAAVMLILCSCGSNATGQDSKFADDSGQTEIRLEETDAAEESDISDTEENDAGNPAAVPLPEEFVLVQGGTFQMAARRRKRGVLRMKSGIRLQSVIFI